jgi:hypothetical protein
MRLGLFEVAALQNRIDVAVPAEKLFDFVVDVRNEPRWNPQMLDAQMLSPEPVGGWYDVSREVWSGRWGGVDRVRPDRSSPLIHSSQPITSA